MAQWGFLTNHALVLIHVANNPRSTLREIADAVGITERAALSILRAMEEDKIITRQREGRRNRYWIDFPALWDHQLKAPYSIAELVDGLSEITKNLQAAKR